MQEVRAHGRTPGCLLCRKRHSPWARLGQRMDVVITPRHAGLDPVSMDSSVRWNDGRAICMDSSFDYMAEMVPYNLPHFPHPCGSAAGGRTMQEQLSRATHGAVITPRHAGLDPVSMDFSLNSRMYRHVLSSRAW